MYSKKGGGVEASLKLSIANVQFNFTKAQEKSSAAINHLEKQNEDKLSQYNTSDQSDLEERQKVIILVSLFVHCCLSLDLSNIFLI